MSIVLSAANRSGIARDSGGSSKGCVSFNPNRNEDFSNLYFMDYLIPRIVKHK